MPALLFYMLFIFLHRFKYTLEKEKNRVRKMMNYILPVMVIFSFICAAATGRMNELSVSVVTGADNAVSLLVKLVAVMCFWGGLTQVAEESGITAKLSRMISPALKLIFPKLKKEKYALEAISMNVTANMLGLGNAATPLGLEAMRRLQDINGDTAVASDEMVLFVVMNTAAMRIIPTTVATLRGQYGSEEPMSVLVPTVLTTASALAVGIAVAKAGCILSAGKGGKR